MEWDLWAVFGDRTDLDVIIPVPDAARSSKTPAGQSWNGMRMVLTIRYHLFIATSCMDTRMWRHSTGHTVMSLVGELVAFLLCWLWLKVMLRKRCKKQTHATHGIFGVRANKSLYWSCRKRVRYKDQLTAEDTYQWWRWWHRESSFAKHLEVHVHNLESLGRLGCIWNGKMLLVGLKLSCNKWQNIPHCSEQFVSSQNQSCWNIIVIVYLWIRRQTFQQIYIYITWFCIVPSSNLEGSHGFLQWSSFLSWIKLNQVCNEFLQTLPNIFVFRLPTSSLHAFACKILWRTSSFHHTGTTLNTSVVPSQKRRPGLVEGWSREMEQLNHVSVYSVWRFRKYKTKGHDMHR